MVSPPSFLFSLSLLYLLSLALLLLSLPLSSTTTNNNNRSGSLPFNGPDLLLYQTIPHMSLYNTALDGAIPSISNKYQDRLGRLAQCT